MTTTAKMIEPAGRQTVYVPILTQPTPLPGRGENTHLEVKLRYHTKVGYILSVYPVSVEENAHSLSVGYGIAVGGTNENIQAANRLSRSTLAKLWDTCMASINHRVGDPWAVVERACVKASITV